jgi:hypothetical protein
MTPRKIQMLHKLSAMLAKSLASFIAIGVLGLLFMLVFAIIGLHVFGGASAASSRVCMESPMRIRHDEFSLQEPCHLINSQTSTHSFLRFSPCFRSSRCDTTQISSLLVFHVHFLVSQLIVIPCCGRPYMRLMNCSLRTGKRSCMTWWRQRIGALPCTCWPGL